jgi:hypothetical protein
MSSTHLGPKTKFYYCQTVADLLMTALSDERLDLTFSDSSAVGLMTKVKVNVTLRLAAYRQSFPLGAKFLEDHD